MRINSMVMSACVLAVGAHCGGVLCDVLPGHQLHPAQPDRGGGAGAVLSARLGEASAAAPRRNQEGCKHPGQLHNYGPSVFLVDFGQLAKLLQLTDCAPAS